MISFLLEVFNKSEDREAIVFGDSSYTYAWLLQNVHKATDTLNSSKIPAGSIVAIEGDFSPTSVAWLLSLIQNRCIIVPISKAVGEKRLEFLDTAEVEFIVKIEKETVKVEKLSTSSSHDIYQSLRTDSVPGLVLFSSGSTGKSKAAVHDFSALLEKFKIPRQSKRILAFLLFDHIGGVNTLLYTLSNAGCLVTIQDRAPDLVARSIVQHKVQILPTSPTFLNLLLIKNIPEQYDLSCLELITYGTEVMPEATLKRITALLPNIKFQQTYGLSEIGILRSKSQSNDSLWVKIGGEGYETRVVNGLLEVKAKSAMRGYLNAPSPFTADGWFMTGDAVEVDGEYFKILGRTSELINVGGEKVYPAEVESLLLDVEGVEDVAVTAEKNPILGNIVVAKVVLSTNESLSEFRTRMRNALSTKCEPFKIPQKIVISTEELHGARFKKMRKLQNGNV